MDGRGLLTVNILQAYEAAPHGGAIVRPSGARVEKWMSDKPGLAPAALRFIQQNVDSFDLDNVAADDWTVE